MYIEVMTMALPRTRFWEMVEPKTDALTVVVSRNERAVA